MRSIANTQGRIKVTDTITGEVFEFDNTNDERLLKMFSKSTVTNCVKTGKKTTICCLSLENGFEVIGESACVDPKNFNDELGKKYAYESAFNKLWELEGYRLQSELHALENANHDDIESAKVLLDELKGE
jgi:hypothetical protein